MWFLVVFWLVFDVFDIGFGGCLLVCLLMVFDICWVVFDGFWGVFDGAF